jgi:hypothetical protein
MNRPRSAAFIAEIADPRVTSLWRTKFRASWPLLAPLERHAIRMAFFSPREDFAVITSQRKSIKISRDLWLTKDGLFVWNSDKRTVEGELKSEKSPAQILPISPRACAVIGEVRRGPKRPDGECSEEYPAVVLQAVLESEAMPVWEIAELSESPVQQVMACQRRCRKVFKRPDLSRHMYNRSRRLNNHCFSRLPYLSRVCAASLATSQYNLH